MEILYRSENLAVRRRACADRSRWVITFDHYGSGAGLDRPGFGEAFLWRQGISALHILGHGNDWYQYPDIREACRAARIATRDAARRIAYGSSMGGYAALRLANQVRADAVLALSPQYSNDPAVVPWETRWAAAAARIAWRPELSGPIRCRCHPVVVYDPLGDDRRHADLIARDVHAVLLPVRHGGHPVIKCLRDAELLQPILLGMVDGSFDPAPVAVQLRKTRSRNAVYLGILAEAQPMSRQRLAVAIARKAVEVRSGGPSAKLALAKILARDGASNGESREALALLEEIVEAGNRNTSFLIPYADALYASGRTDAALEIAREVVDREPDTAPLRHWLAQMLWQRGDCSAAIAEERVALRLDPRHSAYVDTLAQYSDPARRLTAPVERRLSRLLKPALATMRRMRSAKAPQPPHP